MEVRPKARLTWVELNEDNDEIKLAQRCIISFWVNYVPRLKDYAVSQLAKESWLTARQRFRWDMYLAARTWHTDECILGQHLELKHRVPPGWLYRNS